MTLIRNARKQILSFVLVFSLLLSSVTACILPLSASAAVSSTVTVPAEGEMTTYVTQNAANNRLVGLEPTVGEEGTAAPVSIMGSGGTSGLGIMNRVTDGSWGNDNRVNIALTNNLGNRHLLITYALVKRTAVSDVIVVCRQYDVANFLIPAYEIYVSDDAATLYNESNLVYKKVSGTDDGGGQRIQFADPGQVTGRYVGFRFDGTAAGGLNQFQIGELGVYGENAVQNYEATVPTAENMTAFVTENAEDNRLAGVAPTVATEDGESNLENLIRTSQGGGVQYLDRLTDGAWGNDNRISFQLAAGDAYVDVTYSLAKRTTVSDLIVVCREYATGFYLNDYEVYVADDKTTLYTATNRVYKKTTGIHTGGGQHIQFSEDASVVGQYVGFRFLSASSLQVGELGVYGTDAAQLTMSVKQTDTHSDYFQEFITNNLEKNLLKGLTPTVEEEGTSWPVNSGEGGANWANWTDGDYDTGNFFAYSGQGAGVLRFTYALPHNTLINALMLVCKQNDISKFAMDYEIYASDSSSSLYNIENRVFSKTGEEYQEGGQLVELTGDGQRAARYVGIRLLSAVLGNNFQIGELGVYGQQIAEPTVTVKQTDTDKAYFENFLTANLEKNLLKGVIPTVEQEGTSWVNPLDQTNWGNWTDGDYATSVIYFPAGLGTPVLRYTFALPHNTKLSALMLVCRGNEASRFAPEYEVYASDSSSTLYDAENLIFSKSSDKYTEGGQLLELTGDGQRTAYYIGLRLLDAENRYHIAEVGVYGEEVAAPDRTVKQTVSDSQYFEEFFTNNLENNLLKDLIPSVEEEGTPIGVNLATVSSWSNWADGNYDTYNAIFPTGNGTGVLRFTYAPLYHVQLSAVMLVCRENKTDAFALEYEVYASEDPATLYNAENCIFRKTGSSYTEGGQLLELTGDAQRPAYYIGFRLLNATNRYHIGELGIYGSRVSGDPPYIVRHTAENQAEIEAQLLEDNLLKGLEPTMYDLGAPDMPWRADANNTAETNWLSANGAWSMLTDGELFQTTLEDKRRVDIMQGHKIDSLVLTYELKDITTIDRIVMIGVWSGSLPICIRNYKLYISDTLEDLYDGANMILQFDSGDKYNPEIKYSGAGQMYIFNEKPVGKYFGIKFVVESDYGDNMVRLEEIGIYGSATADTSVNLLDGKLSTAYWAEGESRETVTDDVYSAANRRVLTDGELVTGVDMKTQGRALDLTYDLGKAMTFSSLNVTAAEGSTVDQYVVYAAASEAELWSESSIIGTYEADGAGTLTLDKAHTARYIRIAVTEYTGDDLQLAEVAAFGSVLQNPTVKNQLNDLPAENIKIYIEDQTTFEREEGMAETLAALMTLVDNDASTSAQIVGAEAGKSSLDILFKLPALKAIHDFSYTAAEGCIPQEVRYYVGQSEEEVFGKDAVPAAVYTYTAEDPLTHTVSCVPTVGLYVRVSVLSTEELADDGTMAATIADLKAFGFYVEGIADESGDPNALKSFKDEITGLFVKVLKLYSNDMWTKIVRMEIKQNDPTDAQQASLTDMMLEISGKTFSIYFYDANGQRVTDLGGRGMSMVIPTGDEVTYLGQVDGDTVQIVGASYVDEGMYYEMAAEDVAFDFAVVVDGEFVMEDGDYSEEEPPVSDDGGEEPAPDNDAVIPDPDPDPEPEPETEPSDGTDADPDTPQEPESNIGKGQLTKPTTAVSEESRLALFIGLGALLGIELIVLAVFLIRHILLKKKSNKEGDAQ